MICPNCGRKTPDRRKFCAHCKVFLGWDDSPDDDATAVLTPVGPAADSHSESWDEPIASVPTATDPVADTTETAAPAPVIVTIGLPGDQTPGGQAAIVNVDAGGEATLAGVVSNQSGIVDSFDLHVRDLPATWWTIVPPVVSLVPFGAESGTHEQQVTIRLHPPRSSESRAGPWPIELVAVSRAKGVAVASANATLVIAPFEAFESRLWPQRARGKRSASYYVPVLNSGNDDLYVRLRGEDAEGEVRFAFAPAQLEVPPAGKGSSGEARSRVRASARRPLVGVDRERRLTVFVDSSSQMLSGEGVFVQRPWLTRRLLFAWRIVFTLLACTLLVGGAFLDWSDQSQRIKGACLSADWSGCMRYDRYLELAGYFNDETVLDIAPDDKTIPAKLLAPFNFVTSLGFVTIILGVVALVGARSGTMTWLAGAAAVIGLIVYFVILGDTSGEGAWLALVGGICALAAGILAAATRR
jgi:hypothetical protein